jgi:hypothetical protein
MKRVTVNILIAALLLLGGFGKQERGGFTVQGEQNRFQEDIPSGSIH